jgi:hypothetical protein
MQLSRVIICLFFFSFIGRLDFHLVQFFFACLPSLGMPLAYFYVRMVIISQNNLYFILLLFLV